MSSTLQTKPFEGCKSIQYFDLPELYYKPEPIQIGEVTYDSEPSVFEYMIYLFITNGEEQYGYYCGLKALNGIGGTTQVPALQQIRSNNIAKETEYFLSMSQRFTVYPSEVKITKENAIYLQILDTIEEEYNYFDDIYDFFDERESTQEENVLTPIKRAIGVLNLSLNSFNQYLERYSARTKEIVYKAYK